MMKELILQGLKVLGGLVLLVVFLAFVKGWSHLLMDKIGVFPSLLLGVAVGLPLWLWLRRAEKEG